ncbi:MAG: META domain-containing protein [Anaerolineales bacterium]|nr:META domain-containing protein [Anaerolineales bacterium]
MKTRTFTLIFVAAGVVLTACGRGRGGPTSPASLEGTPWTLTAYADTALIAGTGFTAVFADGQIGGSAGCNSYGGEYALNGNRIEIGMLMMTEVACLEPQGLMEQEQALLAFLGGVKHWEMRDGQLFLFDTDERTLIFVQEE